MPIKCPQCKKDFILDIDETEEWGIDDDLFPPYKCSECGWELDENKDTLRNLGCFALIIFLGFLYVTFLFSW